MANEFQHASAGVSLSQAEFENILGHILDSQVRGDIIISNTAATGLIRLAMGTTGQVLGAGANDPEYFDLPQRIVWTPAADMVIPTSNGAPAGTTHGTNISYITRDFDQTTEEHADLPFLFIPASYDGGNLIWRVIWTAAGGSGTIHWQFNVLSRTNGDVIDAALTELGSVTDTLLTAGDLHETLLTQTTSLPTAGDFFLLRVSRNVASDTLTADAKLLAVGLQFTDLAS